jgi:electron transfer flavoprotein alpha subunit
MTEMDLSAYKGIWVFAERTLDNKLAGVTLELIGEAKKLSAKLSGEEICALLIAGNNDVSDLVKEFSEAGANKVYLVQDENLDQYSTELYAKAVCDSIELKKPSMVLVGATTTGRDLAPRVSSRLNTGLTADCTNLGIDEETGPQLTGLGLDGIAVISSILSRPDITEAARRMRDVAEMIIG